ncbi:dynein heavy chain 7, axonemal-like [Penaeus monodon]|uniref:dynein heavy chain 7, axonemal-like n=1 Tax=Penaeus monodon TaxID=6687 RepID=UPI0018A703F4|nr:dynein heavy chain 7, axonemal-like [Penaeus monodon]
MMAADYQSIAEVSLLSCGFAHARALAARVVGVMAHCQTMLHPHHHYDFGMRAVKTVLAATSRLRTSLPEWSETEVASGPEGVKAPSGPDDFEGSSPSS